MEGFEREQEDLIREVEAEARRKSEATDPAELWGNINEAYEAIKWAKLILLYASPAKRIQLLDYTPSENYSNSFQRIEWMRSDLNKINRLNDDEAKKLRRERDGVKE